MSPNGDPLDEFCGGEMAGHNVHSSLTRDFPGSARFNRSASIRAISCERGTVVFKESRETGFESAYRYTRQARLPQLVDNK